MDADVLIVGSGIMGAAVAAEVGRLRPGTRITIVEAGPAGEGAPARHLHDSTDAGTRDAYHAHVAAGVQSMYVGAATAGAFDARSASAFGLYDFAALGHDATEMPAAASAWNVGGMGSHWTAACPTPWGHEIPAAIASEWEADYERVRSILRIRSDRFGPTPAGAAVLEALTRAFGDVSASGRGPQIMPMGVFRADGVERRRTDPGVILPELDGSSETVTLLSGTLARRILLDGQRALGLEVEDLRTGERRKLRADHVVVAADALRSPQLLFASGVRPQALGRYLNEHAFITGRVFAEPHHLGVDEVPPLGEGEWMTDSLWLPHSDDAQPFHWQISVGPLFSEDLQEAVAMAVGISVYVPTEVRETSRIEFSETETDALGMPRARIHYDYSDTDLALIERATREQRVAFEAVAGADAVGNTLLLPPGSSLHYSGTVRMSETDDGTGVVDRDGAVWGTEGLFVAGNGVLPGSVAANITAAGTVTAVRAARAIVRRLEG
ncbi:GMC oxidoreductase [Microbacterium sp. RG1]|uniref:GMC oxidoreductase n=1 Tax=Microbacterium sp. RG1 TaxID=2489212 RepID=UPI0010CA405C|nr:GMC oxidoreductase [Microbacterium sp. RG1]QCQ15555.1 choline dehydrogenase [Microbacterium sp. RG1]